MTHNTLEVSWQCCLWVICNREAVSWEILCISAQSFQIITNIFQMLWTKQNHSRFLKSWNNCKYHLAFLLFASYIPYIWVGYTWGSTSFCLSGWAAFCPHDSIYIALVKIVNDFHIASLFCPFTTQFLSGYQNHWPFLASLIYCFLLAFRTKHSPGFPLSTLAADSRSSFLELCDSPFQPVSLQTKKVGSCRAACIAASPDTQPCRLIVKISIFSFSPASLLFCGENWGHGHSWLLHMYPTPLFQAQIPHSESLLCGLHWPVPHLRLKASSSGAFPTWQPLLNHCGLDTQIFLHLLKTASTLSSWCLRERLVRKENGETPELHHLN